MQFINSSLDKLVKNLSDEDIKYFVEEFASKKLELLKQRGAYPYEYMNSLERSEEKELPNKECFFSWTKKGKIDDNGEKLDGYINDEEYLTCKKIWDKFDMKDIGDCHNHYWRKDVLLLAHVFEKFIDTYMKFYGLDPCLINLVLLDWVGMQY